MDSNHPFWRLPASFAVQAAQYACLGRPYLCRKHKRVLTKFDDASELALPEYLYHGTLTFGTHLITTPKRCSLCSLLEPIIHAKQDGEYYIGSLPGYSVVLCYLLSEQERLLVAESSSERSMMIIQVTRRVIKPKRRLNWLFSINTKSNLCPYTPDARQRMIAPATTYGDYISQGKPLTARVLNRYQASFAEIKHWLLECQTHHGCRCSLSLEARLTAFAAAVTTIDCQLLRLVVLPRGQPYIALIYVWGPRQRHHRKPTSYGRFALSTCPRTIQDAIAVTRSLGYRYLWVDKYCIDQHNEKEKAHQLDMMDQIYEKADLTIVAAAGCDDTYGLPGAGRHSMRPRTRQSVARLENHAFISCDLPILDILSSTQWFRRGWTFQEMKLSTRCLFFLESQAILACRTTTYYEEFPHLPGSSSASPILPSILSDIQGGLSFLQLEIQITEYLGRTLSYEADALNAFKGLLNRAWTRSKMAPRKTMSYQTLAIE
ncbi:heterokaryon incompatibility protein-domain-containing protein [Paraphoma chrysanthemicola]|nr:heterokaryon incompatibility protein-domain-containing protein [Paraphoma chrysanthemicola]